MTTRAERRRHARDQLRALAEDPDVDRVSAVWTESGAIDIGAMADLPTKVSGKHRWIATAAYVLTEEMVRNEQHQQAGAAGPTTILDHETRYSFGIGCWDCEEPFPVANPDTVCPADAHDDD